MDGEDYFDTKWDQRLRLIVSWATMSIGILFGGGFFVFAILVGVQGFFADVIIAHTASMVGLPSAALASLGLVILLRTVDGPIEVKFLGLEFKGASGPIIMWIACFVAMTWAIHFTWSSDFVRSTAGVSCRMGTCK